MRFHEEGAGFKHLLPNIHNDVLIIQGSADDIVSPAVADHMINTIPNAVGLRLPCAGHGVLFQCFDMCMCVIEQFLNGPALAGSNGT